MKSAVVLAGGRGSRLGPLTRAIPKPMVRLDERPILEFVVAALRKSGVQRILAVLQWMPAPIVAHFKDGSEFGLAIDYLLQEGDLGTAGSTRQALRFLDDEEFIVCASDILFNGDLLAGEEFHRERQGAATVALAQVDDPAGLGVAERAVDGRIVEFREKTPPRAPARVAVNAGIYFLERRALDRVAEDRPTDFGADLFPALAREGAPVFGWDLPGYWRDVGTPQALALARRDVREIPELRAFKTRWPAERNPGRGRLWVHSGLPGEGWTEMDTSSIGEAAGHVWQQLAREQEKGCTLAKLEKLDGFDPRTALAAVGWLAREGKVRFTREGRATRVQLVPGEVEASARSG